MTDLSGLVAASAVLHRVRVTSKAEILRDMAEAAEAAYGIAAAPVFEGALERERLGGTGVDDGVAIPHARIRGLDRPRGVVALLEQGTDFDSPDGRPSDIIFLLLSPDEAGADHLKALALVTRVLRRTEVRQAIRASRSAAALYAIVSQPEPSQAA
jgi:nitrogen PTS system EIIA component